MQYYLPPGSCDDAQALLEREDLTEQDVLDFVAQGTLPRTEGGEKESSQEFRQALIDAYHERRREIRDLSWKLWEGQAFIDEDGRLVPVGGPNNANDNGDGNNNNPLPPLPNNEAINLNNVNPNDGINNNNDQPAANNNNPINNNNNDILAGIRNVDNRNPNLNAPPPPVQANIPFPLDLEEEERRWTQEEEREAGLSIARAVERYRQQGVPEEEFVLLKVPPMERPERASLTFRRICFAVLAVVTAFVCIMLQTIPLFPRDKRPDPLFDKLLYELLHVRHFTEHARSCPYLHRSPPSKTMYPSWWTATIFSWNPVQWLIQTTATTPLSDNQQPENVDCSDGVVHIPTKTVLVDSFFDASTKGQAAFWEPYLLGVNVSWFLQCNPPDNTTIFCESKQAAEETSISTATNDNHPPERLFGEDSCPVPPDPEHAQRTESHQCFRGIHDNMIPDHEIVETLGMGAEMIQQGWDHFTIHTHRKHIQRLEQRVPDLLDTIRTLLRDNYGVADTLRPVAFRVSAVGPLDGSAVGPLDGSAVGPLDGSQTSSYLLRILHRQKYRRWIEKQKRHNELARYSLPWPSTRREPFRDPCVLMSDLEADPRFAIHTSVFLSNGAGGDFRGGVSLYVDDHPSNSNPRRKIQRGVTIDGSRGRLVVSTGGLENRRCRLPTREGIRAALQIWWNCETCGSTHDDDGVPVGRSKLWPVFWKEDQEKRKQKT